MVGDSAAEPGREVEPDPVPDYGQKGTNRDPVPGEGFQDEEVIDYQQRGTGYTPSEVEEEGEADHRAGADDEGEDRAR